MYYFKSYYQPCFYGPNWYGALDYAPFATVLMYNDAEYFCVGKMDEKIDEVVYISESEALAIINEADTSNPNIWAGDKLLHRWDVIVDG